MKTTNAQSGAIRDMFARIAPKYDLMNKIMTGGQDARWRKRVVELIQTEDSSPLNNAPDVGLILDLGAGTGDLAGEVIRQYQDKHVIAADFTLPMMRVGQHKHPSLRIAWSAADALQLPFADNTFDAVISGFLLRNLTNLPLGLSEQYRVLKPHGKFTFLDTTKPSPNIFSPLIKFHMHTIIPALGRTLTGRKEAYSYLPESTENFLSAEELTAHLAAAGFRKIMYRRYMFETIAIHWGEK